MPHGSCRIVSCHWAVLQNRIYARGWPSPGFSSRNEPTEQSSNPCQHVFTMADKLAFLLFGDQSTDTHGFLAEFFRQRERGILANAFLEQVWHALRKEIEGLPRVERSKLPKFLSIQNLNERYHAQGLKHPGVDGALLCISQLAHYIEYVPHR